MKIIVGKIVLIGMDKEGIYVVIVVFYILCAFAGTAVYERSTIVIAEVVVNTHSLDIRVFDGKINPPASVAIEDIVVYLHISYLTRNTAYVMRRQVENTNVAVEEEDVVEKFFSVETLSELIIQLLTEKKE